MLGDNPHSPEAATNTTNPHWKTFLYPQMSPSRPKNSNKLPMISRYIMGTHWAVAISAEKSSVSVGRITLTMLPSMGAMIMPNIRAKRIGKRLAYRLSSGCGLLDKGQSPLELSRPVACLQLGGQAIVGVSRSLTGHDMVSPATEVFPIVSHKTQQIQNRRHVAEKACFCLVSEH